MSSLVLGTKIFYSRTEQTGKIALGLLMKQFYEFFVQR